MSAADSVQPLAFDDDPHIMTMTCQTYVNFPGVGCACNIVDRSHGSAPLDGIGGTGDSMDNFRNAGMTAAPLLGKASPCIFD